MIQTPSRGGRSSLILAALSLAVLAPTAHASFIYTVAPVTVSTNFGNGSNLTFIAANNGAASGILSGSQSILLGAVTQSSTTVQPSTDTGSIPLAPLVITINNQNGGGSGAFTVNGFFAVTRSDTTGFDSSFSPGSITPPSLTLGAFTYTLNSPAYLSPTRTVGTHADGSLSYTITETQVTPEPATFAMAGLAFAALALARRRR